MVAMLEFASLHNPSALQAKRNEVLQQQSLQTIPIAKDHSSIDRLDYLNMLEIFEIVVSY